MGPSLNRTGVRDIPCDASLLVSTALLIGCFKFQISPVATTVVRLPFPVAASGVAQTL
jgi:hypothetical protein